MTVLLNRRAVLLVAPANSREALSFEGLRMQFTAKKTLEKAPNTAEISVFNLAEKSRKALQAEGSHVLLQAGYEDMRSQAVVFSGDARLISHRLDGPDWVTKIECGDGEAALGGEQVDEAFAGGVRVFDVVAAMAKTLKVDKGNLASQAQALGRVFKGGFVAQGRAATILDRTLAAEGFTFSIQNGRLQILKPEESNRETVYVLSPTSGLVDSPEWSTPAKKGKPATLKVKSLLLPQILPGRRIEVKARAAQGIFRVKELTHHGDTHEGEWVTEMEAVPASEDAPRIGAAR